MSDKLTESVVVEDLMKEIRTVTAGRKVILDPDVPLSENGINSMGFMELLIFIEQHWKISLMDQGLSTRDVSSVRALARRVLQEMEKV